MNLYRELKREGIDKLFTELVINRLKSLGYQMQEDDNSLLYYSVLEVRERILNAVNLRAVPTGMHISFAESVCGAFLKTKISTGGMPDSFNFETALKSVKAGDTDVTFADGTSAEDTFRIYINSMSERYMGDVPCYRDFKW